MRIVILEDSQDLARAMRAVSSGTGGIGCCKRSDMGDFRTGQPPYTTALAA